jgi:hypothetical protein
VIRGVFVPLKRLAKEARDAIAAAQDQSPNAVIGWALVSLFGSGIKEELQYVVQVSDGSTLACKQLAGLLVRRSWNGPARLAHPLVGSVLLQVFLGESVVSIGDDLIPTMHLRNTPREFAIQITNTVAHALSRINIGREALSSLLTTKIGPAELSDLLSWFVSSAPVDSVLGIDRAIALVHALTKTNIEPTPPPAVRITIARLLWLRAQIQIICAGDLESALESLTTAMAEILTPGRVDVPQTPDAAYAPFLNTRARIHYTRGHVHALLGHEADSIFDYAEAKRLLLQDHQDSAATSQLERTEERIRSSLREKGTGAWGTPKVIRGSAVL